MDELHEKFALALHQTAHHWRIGVDRRLRPLGLSQSTWRVLLCLHHSMDAQTQNAIADTLGVDGASVVRLIDKLEDDGLVQRGFNPQDRRVRLISLTERGRERIAPFMCEARQFSRELLEELSPEELEAATSILGRLLVRLESMS